MSRSTDDPRQGFYGQAKTENEFAELLQALNALRDGVLEGDPSDRALARAAQVSPTTVGNWLAGTRFPQDPYRVLAIVRAIAATATVRGSPDSRRYVDSLLNEERWLAAYQAEAQRRAGVVSAGVQRAQAVRSLGAGPPAGRPLAELGDPFALEVHRPVAPDQPEPEMPALPTYVQREHDSLLEQVVRTAAEGHSGIAVLVGGASTGKTRACWEALSLLREQPGQWRLWHPLDPTRPDAALRELPSVGPRTVVWLNEAQFYLSTATPDLGEQVAAGLRELLRDPGRAPVLVLATLRPQSWISLTASPDGDTDPYAQARELLIGSDIPVPAAFHVQQMDQVAKTGDARLALAAHLAQDGQVTQFLAGAPELLARYRNAPPAAAAVIQAAMDARRLGISHALPYTFLEKAAPGYLTDFEWDQLGEDWLEQALAYATAPCRGSPGPLTRIRPRPTHAGDAAADHPEPTFMLADYLDHIGRRRRQGPVPPSTSRAASMYIRDPTITDDYQALLVLVELLARYKNLGEHDALGLGVARHEYLVRLIDRADPGADQATALARLLARHGRPDELNIHVLGEDTSIALALVRLASLASGGLDVLEGDTDLSPAARRSGTLASYVFAGPSNGGGRPV